MVYLEGIALAYLITNPFRMKVVVTDLKLTALSFF